MATSELSDLSEFRRSHLVMTGLRALGTATVFVVLYYVIPLDHRPHESIALRLGAGTALFVAVLASEIRGVSKHQQPQLRSAVAMATVIPLFLVLFAWIYLSMSVSNPATFGETLSRTSSLYFTVSVFSTVGFGDITAKTDPARLVVTFQMLADLAVVALVVRLIFGAATRAVARQRAGAG
jgi:hypothetical protein